MNLAANVISIHRMQEQDGSLTFDFKTVTGVREIPICPLLRDVVEVAGCVP